MHHGILREYGSRRRNSYGPTSSHAGGEEQIPATLVPKQCTLMFQTLGVPSNGCIQPFVAARPVVRPAMYVVEQRRMDKFQDLYPPHFEGDSKEDA